MTLDQRMKTPKVKKMMMMRGTQPTTNASGYLIIKSPTNNKNNVLYYLSTHETSLVIMLGKKR